jgi:1,4-alpha-glucan branching enzyme
MGCEFGQWQEWNHDTGLEWQALNAPVTSACNGTVRDLNLVYQHEPALHQADFDWSGFKWIDANDSDNSVLSFIRLCEKPETFVVVICNLTPVVREHYRIGVPKAGPTGS